MNQSDRPTVVIGDHSVASAREVSTVFAHAGYSILATCTDGVSLAAAAREHNPTVLCLDLIMPRLSGLQVLEALSTHVQSRYFVVTAVSSRTRVAEAKRLGVSVYVLKPFDATVLASNLEAMRSNLVLRSAS